MSLKRELENKNEVVLLFARLFEWRDKKHSKITNHQPETGKVYRALKDGINDVYYVSIDQTEVDGRVPQVHGIRITSLKNETPEWSCDFVELNDDNIVEFDISPEDYKKINKWVESDHEDFLASLRVRGGADIIASEDDPGLEPNPDLETREMDELSKKIADALTNRFEPYVQNLASGVKRLSKIDPMFIEVVGNIANFIADIAENESKQSILLPLSREIALSDEFGKGANLYNAVFNLEDYASTSDEDSLMLAIYHMLVEKGRLNLNQPIK